MLEKRRTTLNGICPYFTMFPLDFPYSILHRYASDGEWVMDPFCGRGTTNYAGRLLGLPTIGVDSNPVAVAISQAKLANTTPKNIIRTAKQILKEAKEPSHIPSGEFWDWAFHKDVLYKICCLREFLIKDCYSDTKKALRAIIMGALHGPRPKNKASYFSNQCQRTYAPKPQYAVNYWKKKKLKPEVVNVIEIIEERAERYYSQEATVAQGRIVLCDSRVAIHNRILRADKISWIITSPPYFGLDTYIDDQWLRLWFIGGQPKVPYSTKGQINHSNAKVFTQNLNEIWQNVRKACSSNARLIIRFGGINFKKVDPILIIKESLKNSGWKIDTIKHAGTASEGNRQSLHILHSNEVALKEYDIWASVAD